MIYNYSLYGKVHNSDRKVSYTATIPLGLPTEDFWQRVMAFGKAFDLLKLEVN